VQTIEMLLKHWSATAAMFFWKLDQKHSMLYEYQAKPDC